jgi:hypothetical protein
MARCVAWLLCAAGLLPAEDFTCWIQPCSAEVARESTCDARDPELAEWALTAWQKAARPDLTFATATETRPRIRIYWASRRMRLYGEAHPIMVDGKRGAAIYVNPDVTQLGDEIDAAASYDHLLRDAIVYLTCLHESGRALGLPPAAYRPVRRHLVQLRLRRRHCGILRTVSAQDRGACGHP